ILVALMIAVNPPDRNVRLDDGRDRLRERALKVAVAQDHGRGRSFGLDRPEERTPPAVRVAVEEVLGHQTVLAWPRAGDTRCGCRPTLRHDNAEQGKLAVATPGRGPG